MFLRGKDPLTSDPGISDLDFWLFVTEAELGNSQSLSKLRRQFQKIKSRYLLPGKLELTSRAAWGLYQAVSPASILRDLPLRQWDGASWKVLDLSPSRPIRLLSRYTQCMTEYSQAFSHLPAMNSGSESYYHRVVCRKYLNKALDFAQGSQQGQPATVGIVKQFATVFVALDRLARQVSGEGRRSVAVDFSVRQPSEMQLRVPAKSAENLDLLLSVLAGAGFSLSKAIPEAYLIWDSAECDLTGAERLFSEIVHYYSEIAVKTGYRDYAKHLPATVVSPQMYRGLWCGSLVGPLLEQLHMIPQQLLADSEFLRSIKIDLYLHFLDRLATRLNHNLGVIVSYSEDSFLRPLLYQCIELLIVSSRHVTNDLGLLCDLSAAKLPYATAWIRRLLAQQFPVDQNEWTEAFIQVRSETMTVLDEIIKRES